MANESETAIERELDRIWSLGIEDLRAEWRRLHDSDPPRISRDLLVLALGYRSQEIEHGGLGKGTRRKLQPIAKALRTTGRVRPTPSLSLKPGARLVHGGMSLGAPKGNKNALKHGHCTAEAIARRREIAKVLRS